jgi:hypothetical protein
MVGSTEIESALGKFDRLIRLVKSLVQVPITSTGSETLVPLSCPAHVHRRASPGRTPRHCAPSYAADSRSRARAPSPASPLPSRPLAHFEPHPGRRFEPFVAGVAGARVPADRRRRCHAVRLLSPRAGPLRAARRSRRLLQLLAAGRPMPKAAEPKRQHVHVDSDALRCGCFSVSERLRRPRHTRRARSHEPSQIMRWIEADRRWGRVARVAAGSWSRARVASGSRVPRRRGIGGLGAESRSCLRRTVLVLQLIEQIQ